MTKCEERDSTKLVFRDCLIGRFIVVERDCENPLKSDTQIQERDSSSNLSES